MRNRTAETTDEVGTDDEIGGRAVTARWHLRRLVLPFAPSVRLRLTVLYGGLFLLCGTALLAITNVLVRNSTRFTPHPEGLSTVSTSNGSPTTHPPYIQPTSGGTVNLAATTQAVHSALLHQLFVQSGIALAVMTAASILLGWFVAGRVLRPLHTITATVQQISATNLHRRLALAGPDDELKELGATFDDLLARLETAFNAQRRFVANASHELRTPLTMMRTALDVATGKPGPTPVEVKAVAAKVRRGLDQADRLVESFLQLARADLDPLSEKTLVCLDLTAATALAERSKRIHDLDLTVEQSLASAPVQGSSVLLEQMIGNLVENAVRHNRLGGWIRVVTESDGPHARLIVESSGSVIDQEEVPGLTEPFRRLGAKRTGSDNGFGLGLSVVAAVIDAHRGTLDLRARPDGGLRVTVSLPAASIPAVAGVPA